MAERDTIENKISNNAAQKYKFLIFLFLVFSSKMKTFLNKHKTKFFFLMVTKAWRLGQVLRTVNPADVCTHTYH